MYLGESLIGPQLTNNRPKRKKNYGADTVIHTSASEVVHGPITSADLFPAPNEPSKDSDVESSV